MSATSGPQPEPGQQTQAPLQVTSHAAAITAVVCRVSGESDHDNRRLLDEALAKAIADAPAMLIVDLVALTFCDSACLNALLQARHDAETAGVWLVLSGAGPQLLRLLAITGTDEIFTLRTHIRTTVPCPE
ncbi:STAS domain-containing protein [Kitasatospora sp. RG8]|uniref:STAS domain-containing protein n=1 Tax=Kitasatospora sp. RG8 TaxID=2820815 RepID=UPI001ADF076C|nr:STAS domain-containing protein [Kitasatospora sp. RG8]MBP0450572.1 STAS domain-containing protein [Kitasatospora sp. RG8]